MKKIFVYGDPEKCRNYKEALEFCGAKGVFSQNVTDASGCDGLLLTGGGDVDPAIYGAENEGSVDIDAVRDSAELELVRMFTEASLPILGICRGHQVLNVAFGGDLIQNVKNTDVHKWEEPAGDKVHKILVPETSFLYPIYGGDFFVNSAHHQAVKTLAGGFTVSAKAEDGTLEAMEDRERRIFSVQWHPERMAFNKAREDTVDGRFVFEFFLKQC